MAFAQRAAAGAAGAGAAGFAALWLANQKDAADGADGSVSPARNSLWRLQIPLVNGSGTPCSSSSSSPVSLSLSRAEGAAEGEMGDEREGENGERAEETQKQKQSTLRMHQHFMRTLSMPRVVAFAEEAQPQPQRTAAPAPPQGSDSGALPDLFKKDDEGNKSEGNGWFGNGLTFQEKFDQVVNGVAATVGLKQDVGVSGGDAASGSDQRLLPPQNLPEQYRRPYVLVVDLKALVHSEWTQKRGWTLKKRTGVDFFLSHLSNFYEIVVFSDQPAGQGRAQVDRLDSTGYVSHRLFKEQMTKSDGVLLKDIRNLGRDPATVIMLDMDIRNVELQPTQALLLKPWSGDQDDTALLDVISFLEQIAQQGVPDVREIVATYRGRDIAAIWKAHREAKQVKPSEAQKKGTLWDTFK
jgi:NLI interacting factor-like phosphatase